MQFEDDSLGDYFRDVKAAKQQKRAENRERGAEILKAHGIEFEIKNKGAHLIVTHEDKVVDYWPGTGKFIFRDGGCGRGIFNLLKQLEVDRQIVQQGGNMSLTDQQLDEIEARCNAATPGPWAHTDNVFQIFGHYPADWWKVYAPKKENSPLPSMIVCSVSPRATEEEQDTARKISWNDDAKTYDPGEAAHDVRFIANSRQDIPLLLAEVRRLRKALSALNQELNEEKIEVGRWGIMIFNLTRRLAGFSSLHHAAVTYLGLEAYKKWQACPPEMEDKCLFDYKKPNPDMCASCWFKWADVKNIGIEGNE